MTIALGFNCTDGIVIAADSELSTATGRFDDNKIWYFKIQTPDGLNIYKIALAGSGNANFLTSVHQTIKRVLTKRVADGLRTLDEAEDEIREIIRDIHGRDIYPLGHRQDWYEYSIWTLIGIVNEDGGRLLRSETTGVTQVDRFQPIGVGPELVRYLASLAGPERLTKTQAVSLSAQILLHGSKHLLGVGGKRRVIALNEFRQRSGFVKDHIVHKHEDFAKTLDDAMSPLRFAATDKSVDNLEWVSRVDKLRHVLMEVRSIQSHSTYQIDANSIGNNILDSVVGPRLSSQGQAGGFIGLGLVFRLALVYLIVLAACWRIPMLPGMFRHDRKPSVVNLIEPIGIGQSPPEIDSRLTGVERLSKRWLHVVKLGPTRHIDRLRNRVMVSGWFPVISGIGWEWIVQPRLSPIDGCGDITCWRLPLVDQHILQEPFAIRGNRESPVTNVNIRSFDLSRVAISLHKRPPLKNSHHSKNDREHGNDAIGVHLVDPSPDTSPPRPRWSSVFLGLLGWIAGLWWCGRCAARGRDRLALFGGLIGVGCLVLGFFW